MGNFDCLCVRKPIQSPKKNEKVQIPFSKLTQNDILFHCETATSKSFILKTKFLCDLLESKTFFRVYTTHSSLPHTYFNKVLLCNFYTRKDYSFVLMLKTKFEEDLFSYKTSLIEVNLKNSTQIEEPFLTEISKFLLRGYFLVTILSFSQGIFIMIFNKKKLEQNLVYSVEVIKESEFSSEVISSKAKKHREEKIKAVVPAQERVVIVYEKKSFSLDDSMSERELNCEVREISNKCFNSKVCCVTEWERIAAIGSYKSNFLLVSYWLKNNLN